MVYGTIWYMGVCTAVGVIIIKASVDLKRILQRPEGNRINVTQAHLLKKVYNA